MSRTRMRGMLCAVKAMWPFSKRKCEQKYTIRVDDHRVYVKWFAPIQEWSAEECDQYLQHLRQTVQGTVDPETWELLVREGRTDMPDYKEYVHKIREMLMEEYSLDQTADDVSIDLYHGDQFVISFRAAEGVEYPYYYRGIQLKPRLNA